MKCNDVGKKLFEIDKILIEIKDSAIWNVQTLITKEYEGICDD